MVTDYNISILVDAAVSDDRKAEIVRRLIQVLQADSLALTHATAHALGSRTD